jgi:hypothetical protein
VVEHVGLRIEHDSKRFVQTLKIRDQHLDAALGRKQPDLLNGVSKNLRAANVVIIAVHAGNDCVLQSQGGYGFSHAPRLVPVNRLRTAFGHSAETAAARADVAQQHESCGAMVPAFPDVGTLCRLTYGVQSQAAG